LGEQRESARTGKGRFLRDRRIERLVQERAETWGSLRSEPKALALPKILIGLLVLSGFGCAQPIGSFRQVAPATPSDLGVLVQNLEPSEIDVFINSGIDLRQLYGNSYEVYTDIQTVRATLSSDKIIGKNELFKIIPPASTRFKKNNDANFVRSLLAQCEVADKLSLELGASLTISVDGLKAGLAHPVISKEFDGPTTVKLESKTSRQTVLKGRTNSYWIIWAQPEGSEDNPILSKGSELNLSVPVPGAYSLQAVIQDEKGRCESSVMALGAEHNEKYLGRGRNIVMPAKTKDFDHLLAVHAEEAWQHSRGKNVRIAVIDSGVAYNHPLLRDRIAINQKEIPNNGIDDDGNGLVDDAYGFDFVQRDATPNDPSGHGTFVTTMAVGTIGGIAPESMVLPIRAINVYGMGDIGTIAAAINYAVDQRVDLINLSIGLPDSFETQLKLKPSIERARIHDIIVVTAAGNETTDIDKIPMAPASYAYSNLISVAAIDKQLQLTNYSNYGSKSVKLAAQGGTSEAPIVSAYHLPTLGPLLTKMSGTSMATPLVTGALALIKSRHPGLSAAQVIELFIRTQPEAAHLADKISRGKHLDLRYLTPILK